MAYLAAVWTCVGYSVVVTRAAMLALAAAGVLAVFALAVHLCRGSRDCRHSPRHSLLLASPLFYSQSMMAQLDMPAMVFTAIALLLFLRAAIRCSLPSACTVLVLMKETSIAVPAVFGAALLLEATLAAGALLHRARDRSSLLAWLSLSRYRHICSGTPSLRTTM